MTAAAGLARTASQEEGRRRRRIHRAHEMEQVDRPRSQRGHHQQSSRQEVEE